jgi:hypothetical protein
MRLISRHIKANPDTFAPEMLITVALPMELAKEVLVDMTEDEFKNKLGRELFELMRTKE